MPLALKVPARYKVAKTPSIWWLQGRIPSRQKLKSISSGCQLVQGLPMGLSVNHFLTPARQNALKNIFLCHFYWENVYQGKIERRYIKAKIECVYQVVDFTDYYLCTKFVVSCQSNVNFPWLFFYWTDLHDIYGR